MKQFLLIILFAAFSLQAQTNDTKPLTIGEVRTIKSSVLNENRILNIYLPQGYDKARQYPVIYLLDGSINEDFLHITGLVQFFNMTFSMPDCIVVGIANVDRKRDFTYPTTDEALKNEYPTTGHSAKFIDFIERELQPFVEKKYKTTGIRYIIGQSLGGLLATEILIKRPHLFTHYLIVSPSLWWDNETLLRHADQNLQHNKPVQHVYIAVGEGEHPQMLSGAEKLSEIILSHNAAKTYYFEKLRDENHATILHNSIYKAFLQLFSLKD